jgi:hypothetical protein
LPSPLPYFASSFGTVYSSRAFNVPSGAVGRNDHGSWAWDGDWFYSHAPAAARHFCVARPFNIADIFCYSAGVVLLPCCAPTDGVRCGFWRLRRLHLARAVIVVVRRNRCSGICWNAPRRRDGICSRSPCLPYLSSVPMARRHFAGSAAYGTARVVPYGGRRLVSLWRVTVQRGLRCLAAV